MNYSKSLLVSNLLDPLTKTNDDLIYMYERLAKENKYKSIETRLIEDDEVRNIFNGLASENNWNVTYWITGELSRGGYNLCSSNEENRKEAVSKVFSMIDLADLHFGNNIGIASGSIDSGDENTQYKSFIKSLTEIHKKLEEVNSNFKIIIEPLDTFSHKKNLIGNTDITRKLFTDLINLGIKDISMCWDSAHFALNEEDFEDSIKILSPFISRVHFADAITNRNEEGYGDYHRHFDTKGFMNVQSAKQIVRIINKYLPNEEIYFACEVRTTDRDTVWEEEIKYYEFLSEVFK